MLPSAAAIRSKSAALLCCCHAAGSRTCRLVASVSTAPCTAPGGATYVPAVVAASICCSASRSAATRAVPFASRSTRSGCRSAKALCAASANATASLTSRPLVTRLPFTPRPYSTGTNARKRTNCAARRACSAGLSGAARKLANFASTSCRDPAIVPAFEPVNADSPAVTCATNCANSSATPAAAASPRCSA